MPLTRRCSCAGTELSPAEHKHRLARSPAALPADAGTGAAWEATVDAAWQRRIASGDGVALMLGEDKVEAAVELFISAGVREINDKKCVG